MYGSRAGFPGFLLEISCIVWGDVSFFLTRERWMGLTKLKLFQNERPQEVLQNMEVSHATMTPTQWALKGVGELPHFKNLRLCMEGVGWICWTWIGGALLKILGFFHTQNNFRVCGQQKGSFAYFAWMLGRIWRNKNVFHFSFANSSHSLWIPSCVPQVPNMKIHYDGSPPFFSAGSPMVGGSTKPQPGVQQRTLCGEPMRKETIDTWATTLALRNMYGETSLAKNAGRRSCCCCCCCFQKVVGVTYPKKNHVF